MIRQDISKTFSIDCDIEHPYLVDVCFDLADQIINYIDNYIRNELGLIRIDDHLDSYKGCKLGEGYMSHIKTQTFNGVPLTRYYKLNNNDTNNLILEVVFGNYEYEDVSYSINNTTSAKDNNYPLGFNIQLYYSREYPIENLENDYVQYYGNNSNITTVAELLKNSRIRYTEKCNYIDGIWFFTLPLQIIKNNNITCFTFNNSNLAIPRIGNMQVRINNQVNTYKCFMNVSNEYTTGDDQVNIIDPPKASNILFTNDETYRYGVPKIIKNKTFNNLGNKIPTLPLFLSYEDNIDPSIFSFYSTIEGFLQTSANFSNDLGARFDINGSPYINIGNGLLLKE